VWAQFGTAGAGVLDPDRPYEEVHSHLGQGACADPNLSQGSLRNFVQQSLHQGSQRLCDQSKKFRSLVSFA
jgi:hypothetical protein